MIYKYNPQSMSIVDEIELSGEMYSSVIIKQNQIYALVYNNNKGIRYILDDSFETIEKKKVSTGDNNPILSFDTITLFHQNNLFFTNKGQVINCELLRYYDDDLIGLTKQDNKLILKVFENGDMSTLDYQLDFDVEVNDYDIISCTKNGNNRIIVIEVNGYRGLLNICLDDSTVLKIKPEYDDIIVGNTGIFRIQKSNGRKILIKD